jgi:hypothetical protein
MDFRESPISADPEGQLSHPEDEEVVSPEEAPSEPLGLVDDDLEDEE